MSFRCLRFKVVFIMGVLATIPTVLFAPNPAPSAELADVELLTPIDRRVPLAPPPGSAASASPAVPDDHAIGGAVSPSAKAAGSPSSEMSKKEGAEGGAIGVAQTMAAAVSGYVEAAVTYVSSPQAKADAENVAHTLGDPLIRTLQRLKNGKPTAEAVDPLIKAGGDFLRAAKPVAESAVAIASHLAYSSAAAVQNGAPLKKVIITIAIGDLVGLEYLRLAGEGEGILKGIGSSDGHDKGGEDDEGFVLITDVQRK